jgi:ABC-type nitrate/sulfonate/bicarbonate transport system substrate-binding protein
MAPAAPQAGGAPAVPAPSAPSAPPAPVVLQHAQVGASAPFWVMFVAEAAGFLEREAIQLDKLLAATGNAVVQALASGSVHVGLVAPDLIVLAVEQGAPISIVAGGYNRMVYTLVTQPNITSVQDLRGKSVGVAGINASDAFTLRRMLAHGGLRDGEYDVTAAATSNDRLAALKSGVIAGAVLVQPFDFQAADDGFRLLARSTDAVREYQFTTLNANRPWAAQNEDALVRLVRAYSGAARWLQDPANKEQAIAILAEATRSKPEHARQTYELFIEDVKALTPDGLLNMPGLTTAIELLGEAGNLNPPLPPASKFVDETYLQKARAR